MPSHSFHCQFLRDLSRASQSKDSIRFFQNVALGVSHDSRSYVLVDVLELLVCSISDSRWTIETSCLYANFPSVLPCRVRSEDPVDWSSSELPALFPFYINYSYYMKLHFVRHSGSRSNAHCACACPRSDWAQVKSNYTSSTAIHNWI